MRGRSGNLIGVWGLLGLLHCGCGGDDGSSSPSGSDTTSMSSNGATVTSSSAGGGPSTMGSTSAGGAPSTSGSTLNTSVTGGAGAWVCLVSDAGCLCSTVPGAPGEPTTCTGNYSCCYGLPGSTCYCVDLPDENCQELLDLGYQPYAACPPE